MGDVQPMFKDGQVECPCGCGAWGMPLRNGHPRRCDRAACQSCRNRNNRNKGSRKQRQARKLAGVPDARHAAALSHEELWRGEFRIEVKAGAQVGPMASRFLRMEAQAAAAKAHGDPRPFLAVAMPDGWGNDGLFLLRASVWKRHIDPLIEDAGGIA
jgi:hypothetical protein